MLIPPPVLPGTPLPLGFTMEYTEDPRNTSGSSTPFEIQEDTKETHVAVGEVPTAWKTSNQEGQPYEDVKVKAENFTMEYTEEEQGANGRAEEDEKIKEEEEGDAYLHESAPSEPCRFRSKRIWG